MSEQSIPQHGISLRHAAIQYAREGRPIFPLARKSKAPVIPKSEGGRGFEDATKDLQQITKWWQRWPQANIGIPTGAASGWLVLDIDARHGGSLEDLRERFGDWPETLMARTGGGGWHLVFQHPGGTIGGKKLDGARYEVKCDGGYIVAAPSIHPSGGRYEWANCLRPVPPPQWLLDLLIEPEKPPVVESSPIRKPNRKQRESAGEHWLRKALERTGDGAGDSTGYWLAQQLLTDSDVVNEEQILLDYAFQATRNPADPFDERSVRRWLASAGASRIVQGGQEARSQTARPDPIPFRRHQEEQERHEERESTSQTAPESPSDDHTSQTSDEPEDLHRTDMGNARRFVRLHGDNVRYVPVWGQWLIWDGKRWRKDETDEIARLAKQTVRAMWSEIGAIDDKDEREEAIKWIYRSEASARLQAMLDVAKSEPEIAAHHSAFDADPWLLNVLNGTLDLRTGMLRPHAQADLITKLAPVVYDANARLPLWDRFLQTVTNRDADMIAFLRRAVGYTLTGDTREEKLFFAHGPTRTGKSTFFEAIKAMMGDYAQTADFETFLARQQVGGIRNDVADLVGARLVASIEVDDGKRLAAGLVKTITGGDTIKARHLYKEAFAFRPDFKLWLAANDEPRVDASDGAMWSRILRIKFDANITKKDPRVKATLRDPAKAGPAILAWALRGCLEWQKDGLGVPSAVTEATDEYRQSMDPLRDFVTDCCELTAESWSSSSELREIYEKWCKANGERYPLSGKRFGDALGRRGCVSEVRRMGNRVVRGWRGIQVTAEV